MFSLMSAFESRYCPPYSDRSFVIVVTFSIIWPIYTCDQQIVSEIFYARFNVKSCVENFTHDWLCFDWLPVNFKVIS